MSNNDLEAWKDVRGYTGRYKVSSFGRVMACAKSWKWGRGTVKTPQEIIMVQAKVRGMYWVVGFRKNGVAKLFRVSRLVAIAFVPNPKKKPEVNHNDGNKENNYYKNLSWCTRKENMEHAVNNNLMRNAVGVNHGNCKLTESQVIEIKNSPFGATWLSKKFNVATATIWGIKSGRNWKHLFPKL